MRKRPLCMMCLVFMIVRGILLVLTSGDEVVKVPASSIFFEHEQMDDVVIRGSVYKKQNTSKNQILYLKNNSIFEKNKSYYDSKILIYDDTFNNISIGQTICVRGKVCRFEGARNLGNYDQRLYYAKQSIYGYMWCEEFIAVEGKEDSFLEGLHQFRIGWKQTIISAMREENGPVLCAMLLSEKGEMSEEIKELYQRNGISHVLAISGLHISFIGLGIYHFLRKMGMSYYFAGVVSICFLTGYVLMIGFSVSVFRAYIMLLIRIGADVVGRAYDLLTALLFSAALQVLDQPLYLTDGSFYMSYGAILGIVMLVPFLKEMVPSEKKWISNGLASVAINIILFPIMLWFYYEYATYSIFINIAVIPLTTGIIGIGIWASVLCCIWNPSGCFLLGICDGMLNGIKWLGETVCKFPFSQMVFGKPMLWQVIGYYVMLIVVSASWKKNKKYRGWIVFGVLSILLFVKVPNGKLKVTMLDVGQGDCIYMKGPKGKTYLMDGGSSDVKQVGKYRIEPFLKCQGVGQLDYVFVSHGDSDHYNGVEELLERQGLGVRIKTIVFPVGYEQDSELLQLAKLARNNGSQVAVIRNGQKITEGRLEIQCMYPSAKSTFLSGNEGSMVLGVTFGEFDMLLTGDVEGEGERKMLNVIKGKSYEVLKVSHHGSKNATTDEFLELAKPQVALISAGEGNIYGHPHKETLEKLRTHKCKVYETRNGGAITLESDGDLIDIFPSSI